MTAMTRADVRRVRPALWLVKSATTLTLTLLVLIETLVAPLLDPTEFGRAPLGSWEYLVVGLQVTVFGLALMVWFAPRMSLALVAAVAPVIPIGGTSVGPGWPLVGLIALASLAWLLWSAARTDRAPLGPSGIPAETWAVNPARSGDLRRIAALSTIVASLLILVTSLVSHARQVDDTRSFEARAARLSATAVHRADDDNWIFEINNRRVTRPGLVEAAMEPGQRYGVLIDPLDPDRIVFVVEPEDPSWLIGVAALSLTLLATGLGGLRVRHHQDALVLGGGSTRRGLLQDWGQEYWLLTPDDPDGPALALTRLRPAHIPQDWTPQQGYGPLRWDEELMRDPMADAAQQDEDETWVGEPDRVPGNLAELASWADRVQDHLDTRLSLEQAEQSGPNLRHDVEVTIVGRLAQDAPLALRLDDGRVYLAVLQSPSPKIISLRLWGPLSDWLQEQARLLRWVALPIALAGAWLGVWMAGPWERSIWYWISVVVVNAMLVYAPLKVSSWLGAGAVCRDRQGLRMLGILTDDVIGSSDVYEVTAGRHSVGIRLSNPDDALSLSLSSFTADEPPTVDEAADLVRGWMAQAGPDGRSRRVPTPGLLAAVLMLVIWALVATSTLLG